MVPLLNDRTVRKFMRDCLLEASVSDDYTAALNVGCVVGAAIACQASGSMTAGEAQGWRADAREVMASLVRRQAAGGAVFESQAPVQPVEKGG